MANDEAHVLKVVEVGELADGKTGLVLIGTRDAVKFLSRYFGEEVQIAPSGALVIPPLDTPEGREALVRAIDAYEAAIDDDLCVCAMEEAILAAGKRRPVPHGAAGGGR